MAKVLRTFNMLRTNWKKSTFAAAAIYLGLVTAETEYKKNLLLRRYCLAAAKYGDTRIDVLKSCRHVAVLLNPAAKERNALKEYEKFCVPLLHLAGMKVTVLTTNKDTDAITLASKIPADVGAILIAGGDTTVCEVVTGLMRLKNDSTRKSLPIGILPVGKTNSLANKLYDDRMDVHSKLYRFHVMVNATFSAICEVTKPLDVMEIRNIDENDKGNTNNDLKPIYAVDHIYFGAFRNADAKRQKFWCFQKLRSYALYFYGSFGRDDQINANLIYSSPCSGCVKCYITRRDILEKAQKSLGEKRWWHAFIPKLMDSSENEVNYAKIENPDCGIENKISIKTIEMAILPSNRSDESALRVCIGPSSMKYLEFVKDGWWRVKTQRKSNPDTISQEIKAQKLRFEPEKENGTISIDNEEFEMKKMSVTLLNNVLTIFQLPANYVE